MVCHDTAAHDASGVKVRKLDARIIVHVREEDVGRLDVAEHDAMIGVALCGVNQDEIDVSRLFLFICFLVLFGKGNKGERRGSYVKGPTVDRPTAK